VTSCTLISVKIVVVANPIKVNKVSPQVWPLTQKKKKKKKKIEYNINNFKII
jgi:hypothetical protein